MMKLFACVACVVVGLVIGCENHYVPPSDDAEIVPLTEAEFVEVQKQAFDYSQLAADLKALEMRVANLEKACIDNNLQPPKVERPFSAQDPPKKKLTPRERVKCVIYSTDGCKPCAELKAEIKEQLCGKLGWTCGESDECDFIFRESNAWQTYPTIEFRVDDKPILRITGKMPAADCSNKLKALINNLDRET